MTQVCILRIIHALLYKAAIAALEYVCSRNRSLSHKYTAQSGLASITKAMYQGNEKLRDMGRSTTQSLPNLTYGKIVPAIQVSFQQNEVMESRVYTVLRHNIMHLNNITQSFTLRFFSLSGVIGGDYRVFYSFQNVLGRDDTIATGPERLARRRVRHSVPVWQAKLSLPGRR